MNKNTELQLEVLQNWHPGINGENTGVTVENGAITLRGDVNRLLETVARGRMGQQDSRAAYLKPQDIAGLLVIYRRDADRLPPEPARSAAVETWTGIPIATTPDYPEPFLSAREIEVLSLIADGQSNQEIAQQLYLALNTVKRHAYNIYAKLGVKNRIQAVSKARQLGLIA
jgi:ATP/maltotriose-dependent transcriptional regulator MalT